MDGGRRVLRSLKESVAAPFTFAHARPAAAERAVLGASFTAAPLASAYPNSATARKFREKPRRTGFVARAASLAARPGAGFVLASLFFGAVGLTGLVHNGDYDELVSRYGTPRDIFARASGFSIGAVTITGQSELREADVLGASGVRSVDSLLFLDVGAVRERLLQIPLVESVRVLKLYPNRLVIALEERRPFALWQRDGRISVVAVDGTPIDDMRDDHFLGLPFVVGEGAEKRLDEYVRLLASAGDLKPRIKAGIFVGGRRWNLNMTNGVAVKLPEQDPEGALAVLQRLQREAGILDKDILSVDLRVPDRVAVRLTEEAAASRAAALSRKSHKGGQT